MPTESSKSGNTPPKLAIDELPWFGVAAIAEAMQDPRGKGWLSVSVESCYKSLCRHMFAVLVYGPGSIDESDGLPHLHKVGARCLMLIHLHITAKVAQRIATSKNAQDADQL